MMIRGTKPLIPGEINREYKPEKTRKTEGVLSDRIEISSGGEDQGRSKTDKISSAKGLEKDIERIELAGNQASQKNSRGNNKGKSAHDAIIISLDGKSAGYGNLAVSAGNDVARIDETEDRSKKLAKVREKIADGYYSKPDHLDELAEALLKRFKLK